MKCLPTLLACLAIGSAHADERPLFLPFDLSLGGEKAEMADGNDLFAQIDKPVKPDAVLELDAEVPMLIVNAFPCKEDGTVVETQAAAIIFAKETKQVKLSDTMDKKKLPPGNYLANVVANGKTARIVFQVGESEKKVDFSKILGFLKKKASGE
ncbi:hypothetical protein HAHE_10100 [Haloferula helveola]|uniref:Uncharacterized protein n=1 Tax=Haloferula helveola TaxID=490095 RepID=A0ABN6H2A7_9BACT|nr:hypothetical protein HAHE_10100 [Haloferula helveola]